ncbi:MAG: caspase family protein [Bacteroidales bacterium]|nr:caspase family protein [Bacteroidales bacterium]
MIKRLTTLIIGLVIGSACLLAKNTALLIGIGNYNTTTTGWSVIHGNNDVVLLEAKLKDKGFIVSHLIDNKATKANIMTALSNLVASATNGDVMYLHFSGHGQLVSDMNNDEQEEFDQSFVCYDACFSPKYEISGNGYRGQNHFIDDELFPYLNELKKRVGKKGSIIVVFDTCYSGGADRGERADDPDPESEVEWSDTTRGTDDEFKINRSAETYLRVIKKPGNYTTGGGNITIISACESDKKNYECRERHSGRKYGSLSFCISKMLDNNIPLAQWGEYFTTRKYKSLRIFRPSQNPVVETHR